MPPGLPLSGSYDWRLVALSVIIAVLASGAALDLAGRVTAARGTGRGVWLACGAVVMGLGIWSMHYTGMLAFRLPVPVHYRMVTVGLSLLAAILASFVALLVASRDRLAPDSLIIGSLAMGAGIATMHYTGMAAMDMPATMRWHVSLVVASIVIAVVVSAVALWLAFRHGHAGSDAWTWRKVGSALVMGAAVPAMHYTGMAAASFTSAPEVSQHELTLSNLTLGADAIGAGTLIVLLVAIATSIVDRRVMAQALRLQEALAEVRTLRGMLPICANCKRVRTDQGAWQQIESYMREHTEAEFSHGICPDCARSWEESGVG